MAIFDFASIDNTNIVKNIIVVEKETAEEALSFLNECFSKEGCIWKNYDKNNIKHKNCAIESEYIEDGDYYRLQKSKFPNLASWIFNTTTYEWNAPIQKPVDPEDGSGVYSWRETEYQSTGNGWVFFPTTTD